jgi:hypothetical protein
MTIAEMLARNARMYPDDCALIELKPSEKIRKEITWKEFDERVNRIANALIDRGASKGDKVIHLMMNSINWLETYFGIIRYPRAKPVELCPSGYERFGSPAKLCCYAGLVPSTRSSGGKTYHGRLTSEGNHWLRWALIEAVVPASYADVEIREWLNALRKRLRPITGGNSI